MAAKRMGLGKGLDSLIPDNKSAKTPKTENKKAEETAELKSGEQMMKINMVEPNRDQPRRNFEEDALLELADSIKQYGVLQPLIVRKRNDYYEIIAGERRWRAAKMAGVKEVPVIIKEYNEQEILEIALIENIQREDLNPIEEAMAYPEQQYALANKIFDEKLSVRETEKLIKEIKNPKKPKEKKAVENAFIYEDIEDKMKQVLGTKVHVASKGKGKGKIEIEYYSDKELERMFDMIMSIGKGEQI